MRTTCGKRQWECAERIRSRGPQVARTLAASRRTVANLKRTFVNRAIEGYGTLA